ncbi:uncharacterized protein LOC121233048 isoform X2 [Aquila chrysaetos chrysaetos]|uniref:uncharacterized protein LOC121233048 isoform X2 n=1 Tax=Aquila chrysaetos chrysaetos TaxID=223781 RepID=UPI001B7D43F7|nr:uncharacterized protein LOC121233048 isoform X2 [Aquila chrysaetos chrysaetos]
MKQQLMECSAAVHASQESYPDHAIEEKFIKKFQLMDALRNKVKQNDNDSCLILETMKHIILLSTAILESQQNIIIGSRVNWAEGSCSTA